MKTGYAYFSPVDGTLTKVIARVNPLTFEDLQCEMKRRHIVPKVNDDNLVVEQWRLTDELRLAFVAHREGLVKMLSVDGSQPPLFGRAYDAYCAA